MGIFDRLFKREQEIEEHIIYLNKLDEWYDRQIIPKRKRLDQKIKQAKQKIIQTTQEMQQKLEELNNAKLLNPNIPERAKHFLNGNREAYSKKITSFVDALILPEEAEELPGFLNDFTVQIQTLAQGIARPTQILHEFLSNETRAVTMPLGKIEKIIQTLKEAMQNLRLDYIQRTKDKIKEIQNKLQKKIELTTQLNEIIIEINKTKQENQQLAQEVDILKKDKELNQTKKERENKQEQILLMQKDLLESFSILETALKKYEHITLNHKELIRAYLDSPINALMKDLHLDVINMLSDLKKSAEAGKLEMKVRKTNKTIEEIKKLTKDRLGKFLTEYGQLHIAERKLREKIDQLDVVVVAETKEKKIQKNQNKLTYLMNRMNYLQTELEKVYVDEFIAELEKELSEKCNVRLTISLTPLLNDGLTKN